MEMPELDGWAFAGELRTKGYNPPIVVMTAGPNAERAAREIGAQGFVAKPFEVGDLLAKVEQLCA
jgi:DNA-binding response OmpR family regulator